LILLLGITGYQIPMIKMEMVSPILVIFAAQTLLWKQSHIFGLQPALPLERLSDHNTEYRLEQTLIFSALSAIVTFTFSASSITNADFPGT